MKVKEASPHDVRLTNPAGHQPSLLISHDPEIISSISLLSSTSNVFFGDEFWCVKSLFNSVNLVAKTRGICLASVDSLLFVTFNSCIFLFVLTAPHSNINQKDNQIQFYIFKEVSCYDCTLLKILITLDCCGYNLEDFKMFSEDEIL